MHSLQHNAGRMSVLRRNCKTMATVAAVDGWNSLRVRILWEFVFVGFQFGCQGQLCSWCKLHSQQAWPGSAAVLQRTDLTKDPGMWHTALTPQRSKKAANWIHPSLNGAKPKIPKKSRVAEMLQFFFWQFFCFGGDLRYSGTLAFMWETRLVWAWQELIIHDNCPKVCCS